MVLIREEQPDDADAIRDVNRRAFGQADEAELVNVLRRNCDDLLSLVAVIDDAVVGHILFSPAAIAGDRADIGGMALGPMAVTPGRQRQGIGSRLVRAGIEALRGRSCPYVIVLGHPGYYPRFGFVAASRRGIDCAWNVPDEAFMILVLDDAAMEGVSGVARYRPEFAGAMNPSEGCDPGCDKV